MLGKVSGLIVRGAWVVIALAILLAGAGGYFMTELETEVEFEEMLPQDLESIQTMNEIEELFEVDLGVTPVIVLVKANLSALGVMDEIRDLRTDLEGIDEIAATNSILDFVPEGVPLELFLAQIPEADRARLGRFVSQDLQATLVYLDPHEPLISPGVRTNFIEKLDGVLQQYQDSENLAEIKTTGMPIMIQEVTEALPAQQVQMGIWTLVGIVTVLAIGFRRLTTPVIVLFTIGVALAWTMGAIYFLGIPVTMVTIAVIPLLLGLGIDYSVHYLRRYDEERASGAPIDGAVETSLRTTGGAILIGSVTTMVAFGVIAFSGFPALRDLGLALLIGIFLCALASFTVLPALVTIRERFSKKRVV